MNAAQQSAFQAGAGVGPSILLNAIAGMALTLVIVWVIWIALGSFRAWQSGRLTLFDLIWSSLRASIVLLVLGYYLR